MEWWHVFLAIFAITAIGFFLQLVKSWIVALICRREKKKADKADRWAYEILK